MPKRRVVRHEVIQPLDPSYKIIALTQGQSTKVTATDYNWLNQWPWYASWNPNTKSFYAKRKKHIGKHKHLIQMAVEILRCKPKEQPDHRNHDTLDNRRKNLRKATASQNSSNRKIQSRNTSGYIGVSWVKNTKKWHAQIVHKYIHYNLGYFTSAKKAAIAYDKAARKLHGKFASLNFQK